MYTNQMSSWLVLAPPLVTVVFVALLLSVLWLAVRIVRHAWHWEKPQQLRRRP